MSAQRIYALAFWVVFFGFAFLDPYLKPAIANSLGYLLVSGLICLVLILAWFTMDARSRNISPSIGLKVSMLVLPPVAAVYYRFKQTGWKRGLAFTGFLFVATAIGIGACELLWWIVPSPG